jgi:tricarballylate dehydrogenase
MHRIVPHEVEFAADYGKGSMTALNFLEECERLGKKGRVCIVESGKEGERCGASRWTMAYLRLDKGS